MNPNLNLEDFIMILKMNNIIIKDKVLTYEGPQKIFDSRLKKLITHMETLGYTNIIVIETIT